MTGNEHIRSRTGDTNHINEGSPVAEVGMYFRLSARTKHDLPIVNHTWTRDVEAQTVDMGAPPSFVMYEVPDLMALFWSFVGSTIVWCIRWAIWYLQRIVG